jgi:hypothetical protein
MSTIAMIGSGPAASATANGRISPIALPTGRLPTATRDVVKVPIEMGGRRHNAPKQRSRSLIGGVHDRERCFGGLLRISDSVAA